MYTHESAKNNNKYKASVKTFPNLSAIEQMNKYTNDNGGKNQNSDKYKSEFDIYTLLIMVLLFSKESLKTESSILPILFSLMI